jgi:hypothetical protein
MYAVCVFKTGFCYIAYPDFELSICLPLPLDCWDYRNDAPCPAGMFALCGTAFDYIICMVVRDARTDKGRS